MFRDRWLRTGLLLGLAALFLAACLGPGPVVTPPREVPGRLAYLSGADVWIWQDGHPVTRVTADGRNLGPLWSPDGRWLAYIRRSDRSGELWAVAGAGAEPQRIAPSRQLPYSWTAYRWSPAGDAIAFIALADERPNELWVAPVGADGPGRARRVFATENGIHSFAWSPDGSALAIAAGSNRMAAPEAESTRPARLVVVPATGGDGREVLRWAEQAESPGEIAGWTPVEMSGLTWSPDGRWLTAFGIPESASLAVDGVGLYLISGPADGSAAAAGWQAQVRGLGTTLAYRWWVRWSPAGGHIATVSGAGRSPFRTKQVQVHEPARESPPVILTPAGAVDRDPDWSPRGDRLAVSRAREQIGGASSDLPAPAAIWLIDPDTGQQQALTERDAGDHGPRWAADGASLMWVRVDSAGAAAWWAPVDDDAARPPVRVATIDTPPGLYGAYHVAAVLSWYSGP